MSKGHTSEWQNEGLRLKPMPVVVDTVSSPRVCVLHPVELLDPLMST